MDGTTAPSETGVVRRHRFTAADVRRMVEAGILPDKARIELIGGELIDMPSEGGPHWEAKTEIVNWLLRRLPPSIKLAPDGPLRLSDDNEPEPYFFLYPAAMRVNAVRGPDTLVVVEVADSSLEKDRDVKAPVYAAHGVREYWIVALGTKSTLVHRLNGDAYGQPVVVAFDAPLVVHGVAEAMILASILPT